jgi:predicted ATPase
MGIAKSESMSSLRSISLKGWKSIRACEIELRPLNVLLGANGAGKSSLLSFFKLLIELIGERLQTQVQTSGGANSVLHFGAKQTSLVEAELNFETDTGRDRYFIKLVHGAPDRLIIAEETGEFFRGEIDQAQVGFHEGGHLETVINRCVNEGDRVAKTIRYLISRCRIFHFHDTSETSRLRLALPIDNNRFLYPDAGNVAAMLYLYSRQKPAVFHRIISAIQQVAPFIDDFVLEPQRLNLSNIVLKWRQNNSDYELGPHQLSDGTLRMIALATLLLQPEEDLPLLIVLDEPELGLHPAAISVLASMLRHASKHCQILLATQSVTLADQFDASDIIVAEQRDNASEFRRLDAFALKEWLDEYTVGQLWEKNVFGGGPY